MHALEFEFVRRKMPIAVSIKSVKIVATLELKMIEVVKYELIVGKVAIGI